MNTYSGIIKDSLAFKDYVPDEGQRSAYQDFDGSNWASYDLKDTSQDSEHLAQARAFNSVTIHLIVISENL